MENPLIIVILVLALAAIGAFAGLIAGMLGIGGGIVIVPALYHVQGILGIAEAPRACIWRSAPRWRSSW
ncbi:MAG TPA: hypothetical protein VGC25_02610 [Alphaproteobacteria bacterium]